MNKYLLVGLCGLLCSSTQAAWVTLTANPDDFPAGLNVSNAFPGITLTNRYYDTFDATGNQYPAVVTAGTSSGNSLAATGRSWTGFGAFSGFAGNGSNLLQIQFSEPTDFLSLEILRVSNDGATVILNDLSDGPSYGFGNEPTITVARPTRDISQAWIRLNAPPMRNRFTTSGYGFIDSISYNATVVPEPAAFASCGLAVIGLLASRRAFRRANG